MIAGHPCQPRDGVAVDADQSPGLARAVAFGQVPEHRDRRLGCQVGAEERRALAFGEAGLARLAVEEPDVVVLAVTATDGEVARVAHPVERAAAILAAAPGEVGVVGGHGTSGSKQGDRLTLDRSKR
jgi:hypothetical protein